MYEATYQTQLLIAQCLNIQDNSCPSHPCCELNRELCLFISSEVRLSYERRAVPR